MKKYILFILFNVTLLSSVMCQKNTYKNGELFTFLEKNGVVVSETPLGKDVEVIYDVFFKKFKITFTDSDNLLQIFNLNFVNKDSIYLQMVDDHENMYDVSDLLAKNNKLIMFSIKKFDSGVVGGLVIRNLKKQ